MYRSGGTPAPDGRCRRGRGAVRQGAARQGHFLRRGPLPQQEPVVRRLSRPRGGVDRPPWGHQCPRRSVRRLHRGALRQPQAPLIGLRHHRPHLQVQPPGGRHVRWGKFLGRPGHRREAGQPGGRPGPGAVPEPPGAGTPRLGLRGLPGLHSNLWHGHECSLAGVVRYPVACRRWRHLRRRGGGWLP